MILIAAFVILISIIVGAVAYPSCRQVAGLYQGRFQQAFNRPSTMQSTLFITMTTTAGTNFVADQSQQTGNFDFNQELFERTWSSPPG